MTKFEKMLNDVDLDKDMKNVIKWAINSAEDAGIEHIDESEDLLTIKSYIRDADINTLLAARDIDYFMSCVNGNAELNDWTAKECLKCDSAEISINRVFTSNSLFVRILAKKHTGYEPTKYNATISRVKTFDNFVYALSLKDHLKSLLSFVIDKCYNECIMDETKRDSMNYIDKTQKTISFYREVTIDDLINAMLSEFSLKEYSDALYTYRIEIKSWLEKERLECWRASVEYTLLNNKYLKIHIVAYNNTNQ